MISEFLSRHKGCNLYFLATQEAEEQNRKVFRDQVADLIGNDLLKTADTDWLTIFKLFSEHAAAERKIIVMDEFQYIGKSNRAFPSVMQKVWDTVLKDKNIMLILCGSLITLMEQQTLDYSSPLYGRRTAQFRVKQIRKMFVQNYLSYVYENLCREKMWEFSSMNLWNFRFDKLGRYWGPICGEVDILGTDSIGGNMIIGECKYTAAEKGLTVLHTLQEWPLVH